MLRHVLNACAALTLALATNAGAAPDNNVNANNNTNVTSSWWPQPWCPPFMPRQFCPK